MRIKEENIEDRTLLQGIYDLLHGVKGLLVELWKEWGVIIVLIIIVILIKAGEL